MDATNNHVGVTSAQTAQVGQSFKEIASKGFDACNLVALDCQAFGTLTLPALNRE
ncbi:MAG: hypothetical protein H0T62_02745 [Parachlamydiaceae bacterium]|nr:hypothetical protein [Parachlamydiaceae bacterium]